MRKRERSPFGVRLKQAREKAGLTQPQLAEAVGMGQSTLAEAEGVGYSSSFTVRIAQVCRVSALWLESGEGEMEDQTGWPFRFPIARFLALRPEDRSYVEGRLEATIESLEYSVTTRSGEMTARPLPDQEVGRRTVDPALKARPNVERVLLKDQRAAGRKTGEVQKPGTGRGTKGAARRG